jgi:hypothetical protein
MAGVVSLNALAFLLQTGQPSAAGAGRTVGSYAALALAKAVRVSVHLSHVSIQAKTWINLNSTLSLFSR